MSKAPIGYKILLVGASGRMGLEIAASVARENGSGRQLEIVGGLVAPDDPAVGTRLEGISNPLASEWQESFAGTDVIIDFSSAAGARKALAVALAQRIPLVECSTGLNQEDDAAIREAGTRLPLIRTRNTSVGVTVLAALVAQAARMLPESFDIELVELHHRYKADAPSGTALLLLEQAAAGRNTSLSERLHAGRAGDETRRIPGEIGAQAVRGGDVAGDHTVFFLSDGERVELSHRATSRRIFADGSLRAADWLVRYARDGGKPGIFTMNDVVGIVSPDAGRS